MTNLNIKAALGVLGVAWVAEASLPGGAPATQEEALIALALWGLKLLGAAVGVVLLWYTRRITQRIEKVLDFYEKAPADAWSVLRAVKINMLKTGTYPSRFRRAEEAEEEV